MQENPRLGSENPQSYRRLYLMHAKSLDIIWLTIVFLCLCVKKKRTGDLGGGSVDKELAMQFRA